MDIAIFPHQRPGQILTLKPHSSLEGSYLGGCACFLTFVRSTGFSHFGLFGCLYTTSGPLNNASPDTYQHRVFTNTHRCIQAPQHPLCHVYTHARACTRAHASYLYLCARHARWPQCVPPLHTARRLRSRPTQRWFRDTWIVAWLQPSRRRYGRRRGG